VLPATRTSPTLTPLRVVAAGIWPFGYGAMVLVSASDRQEPVYVTANDEIVFDNSLPMYNVVPAVVPAFGTKKEP